MIPVEQLAEIVSRKVSLKLIGRKRWSGLCPFHQEKSPSFQIWTGRRGEGRFHCHGCGADGDAVDWLRKVEHKTYREAGGMKPDPELRRERERQKRREQLITEFRDGYPECSVPDDFIDV